MLRNWSIVRTFNADMRRYLASWTLSAFAYFGIITVLLNLYLLRAGFDVQSVGIVVAAGQIAWAVCALPAGAAGRRFGLKAALIGGYALIGAGMALLLLVEYLPRELWVPWVVVTWTITWAGASFVTVTGRPFLMQASDEENRRYSFSAQPVLTRAAAFVGSLAAGLLPLWIAVLLGHSLDDAAPYRYALWLVPIAYLLSVLIMLRVSPFKIGASDGADSRRSTPTILFLLLGLIVFLQSMGNSSVNAFFNVYLDTELGVDVSLVGVVMGMAQLLPILVALVMPSLLARWGAESIIMWVGLLLGAALFALAFITHWLVVSLIYTIVASLFSAGGISRGLFSQELVSAAWRTTSSAILTIGMALGGACMAAIGGYLIGAVGFHALFWVGAGFAFLSSAVIVVYRRLGSARPEPTAVEP